MNCVLSNAKYQELIINYTDTWKCFVARECGHHPCSMDEFAWYCRAFTDLLQESMLETLKVK
jgi:hypothetical protein